MKIAYLGVILFVLLCTTVLADTVTYEGPDILEITHDCKKTRPNTCSNIRYDTFNITYTTDHDIPAGSQIDLIQGYTENNRIIPVRCIHSWQDIQTHDPSGSNHASARTSVPLNFALTWLSTTGSRCGDLAFMTNSIVPRNTTITFIVGDTSRGSPGQEMPGIPHITEFFIRENGQIRGSVLVEAGATRVDTFYVTAPTTPQQQTFEITVRPMEGIATPTVNSYAVQEYTGTVAFRSSDPQAQLPPPYTFTLADKGVKTFTVTLPTRGTHTIDVYDTANTSLQTTSNPILVRMNKTKDIKWGSVHMHVAASSHGVHTVDYAFPYSRDAADLDFQALSEHCESIYFDWNYFLNKADQYNNPPDFVTLPAYEWTDSQYGHRHVVYRDRNQRVPTCYHVTGGGLTPLEYLMNYYDDENVILIPHHSAWHQVQRFPNFDWGPAGITKIQRLVEMYSWHGSSEYFNNPFIIHRNPTEQRARDSGAFVQDAIAQGYKMGFTADADQHHGKAGLFVGGGPTKYSRMGLTAVLMDTTTPFNRENLWDTLYDRRTYATTGARIYLDFKVNSHLVGEETFTYGRPVIKVHAIGTDTITNITLMRNGNETLHVHQGNNREERFTFVDRTARKGEEYSYYVRVEQMDQHYAWSSPIWIKLLRPTITNLMINPINDTHP